MSPQICKENWNSIPFTSEHFWKADHHNLPSGNCLKCGKPFEEWRNELGHFRATYIIPENDKQSLKKEEDLKRAVVDSINDYHHDEVVYGRIHCLICDGDVNSKIKELEKKVDKLQEEIKNYEHDKQAMIFWKD